MAKYKNYLARVSQREGNFLLARGEDIGHGLAVVRLYKDLDPIKKTWRIIDIASGLHLLNPFQTSKNKALETYVKTIQTLGQDFIDAIDREKSKKTYRDRVDELQNEKRLWRLSGYEID